MPQSSDLKQLVERYLGVCESIYPTAVYRSDVRLAGLIAKSALSVTLNMAENLDASFTRTTAVEWFERLASLYQNESSTPPDIVRTLNWASSQMISVFNKGGLSFDGHDDLDEAGNE